MQTSSPHPGRRFGRHRRVVFAVASALLGFLVSACPDNTPTAPTPPPSTAPTIATVAPSTGSSLGGTSVTITGTNFAAGATVTIGGVAATDVLVVGANSLRAVTGARAAGAADVVVTVGTQSGTLAAGFTYVAAPPPTITAIAPTSGPTGGGTTVTIAGTNFATGATLAETNSATLTTVTIGGVAATNVTVLNSTTIQAVTGARVSGAGDVVVTVGAQSATLAGGFAFVPPAVNPLPIITLLTIQGTRAKEPANFADVGEEIDVTAAVRDAETPLDKLLFEWTADTGAFSGSGPSVRWRAPVALVTPTQIKVTVKVTETLESVLDGGFPSVVTQSVTASSTVRVHDSLKEIRDLSVEFLEDFSRQVLSPAQIVRNFWSGCPGKEAELVDVQNNQADYTITSYRIGASPGAIVGFQGTCSFRAKKGDGCVWTPVEWHSVCKTTRCGTIGKTETAIGTDQTTAVYRESRWWLCDSDFDGRVTNPFVVSPFIR